MPVEQHRLDVRGAVQSLFSRASAISLMKVATTAFTWSCCTARGQSVRKSRPKGSAEYPGSARTPSAKPTIPGVTSGRSREDGVDHE
jgi:hypothetical protein